jgi:uncharacterized membrane protein YhaH (DUF805 family)
VNESIPLTPVRPGTGAQETSGKAISSLVLGISSFLCWIFTGLPAIILGVMALRDIKRSNGHLKGDGLAIGGIVVGAASTFLIVPVLILVALLLPAIQAAREAARRNMSMNNMKQISIGLLNYHDTKGTFPAAKSEGGSQLSWRVHILPYLEEQALYEQFHLDEPWDSPHNKALIAKMPMVYEVPGAEFPSGETSYLAVTGPNTAFGDGSSGMRFRDMVDGTSRTILFVEADQSVPWTKPDDYQFDPQNPVQGLGTRRLGGFLAAFGDAHIDFLRPDDPTEQIGEKMTATGREPQFGE